MNFPLQFSFYPSHNGITIYNIFGLTYINKKSSCGGGNVFYFTNIPHKLEVGRLYDETWTLNI